MIPLTCSHFWLTCAGYRCRVKFFNVLNPTKNCSYISEVLDAGLLGPLFKVDILSLLCCLQIFYFCFGVLVRWRVNMGATCLG